MSSSTLLPSTARVIAPGAFQPVKELKHDAYGSIHEGFFNDNGVVVQAIQRRYTTNPILRPMALVLAANEKRALKKLAPLAPGGQVPRLLTVNKNFHVRSYLQASMMHQVEDKLTPAYFKNGKELLRSMRRLGVCHNDTAKTANWLVLKESNMPALVDFQLSVCFGGIKSKIFLTCCREDLRHLLKHKRKYDTVTYTERKILANKSAFAKAWMAIVKPVYIFITRKCLGWKDRVGNEERDF